MGDTVMTHDEMIAVIQAHKEGKKIQFKNSGGAWLRTSTPDWDFDTYEYRIKPEPRDFWIHKRSTDFAAVAFRFKPEGKSMKDYIHVREVLDED